VPIPCCLLLVACKYTGFFLRKCFCFHATRARIVSWVRTCSSSKGRSMSWRSFARTFNIIRQCSGITCYVTCCMLNEALQASVVLCLQCTSMHAWFQASSLQKQMHSAAGCACYIVLYNMTADAALGELFLSVECVCVLYLVAPVCRGRLCVGLPAVITHLGWLL
jgi:hypothetical protein